MRSNALSELRNLRGGLPELQLLMAQLAAASVGMGLTLKAVRERLEGKTMVATQTDVQLVGEDAFSYKGGQNSFSAQTRK